MNKAKKIIIAIIVSCLLVFTVTPKRQEQVHAFALESIALAIGAVATLAVGGILLSNAATESVGQDIIDKVKETGSNISDLINIDTRTGFINMVMSIAVLNAMNNVTLDRAASAASNPTIVHAATTDIRSRPIEKDELGLVEKAVYTVAINSAIPKGNHLKIDVYNNQNLGSQYRVFKTFYNGAEQIPSYSGSHLYGSSVGHAGGSDSFITQYESMPYLTHIDYIIEFESPIQFTDDMITIKSNIYPDSIADMEDYQYRTVSYDDVAISNKINATFVPNAEYTFTGTSNRVTSATGIRDITIADGGGLILDDSIPDDGTIPDETGGTETGMLSSILDWIKALPSLIAAAFGLLFESVISAIANAFETFTTFISGLFGSLMGILGSIIDSIWSSVSGVTSAVSSAAIDITNAIWNGVNRVLWDIEGGIRGLAGDVRDLLINLPDAMSGLWEDAGIIWTGLTNGVIDSINTGIDNVNTFADNIVTSIDNAITDMITGITSIVIPTEAVREDITSNFNILKNTFMFKFDFLISPIKSMVNVYNKPRSLYDLYVTIMDTRVYIFPRIYQGAVDVVRIPLTGVFVLMTVIHIYKKGHKKGVI